MIKPFYLRRPGWRMIVGIDLTATAEAMTAEDVAAELWAQYYADWAALAEEQFGLTLDPWQADTLNRIAMNRRTAIASCNGPGKTFVAAVAAWCFMLTRMNPDVDEYPRVGCTSGKEAQLTDYLWPEMERLHGRCDILRDRFICGKEKISWRANPESYIVKRVAKSPDTLGGLHAPHLFAVVEESSGMADELFEAVEGWLTGDNWKILIIFNPLCTAGYSYESFHADAGRWLKIHVGFEAATPEEIPADVSFGAPDRIGESYEVSMRRKWGVHSNVYRARVKGLFLKGATDALVDHARIKMARDNYTPAEDKAKGPLVLSCDPAWFGDDMTVIGYRHGARLEHMEGHAKESTVETSGRIVKMACDLIPEYERPPDTIVIDPIGIGAGVYDQVDEATGEIRAAFEEYLKAVEADDAEARLESWAAEFRVVAFNVANKGYDYPTQRDEMWFGLRDLFNGEDGAEIMIGPNIDEDDFTELAGQITKIKFGFNKDGREKIEPKEKTKVRLGRSPDHGDMVAMCFADLPGVGFSVVQF